MATVYVRDVPDDVSVKLKQRAAAVGTSLSAYVARELVQLASRPFNAELVDRLRALDRSQGPSIADIVSQLEAGRR